MRFLFCGMFLLLACSQPKPFHGNHVMPSTAQPLHRIDLRAGSAYPWAQYRIAPYRINDAYARAYVFFYQRKNQVTPPAIVQAKTAVASQTAPKSIPAAQKSASAVAVKQEKQNPVLESASGKTQKILQTAKKQLGIPYRFGGNQPQTGFDCSGLMVHIHREHGILLPRSSHEQFAQLSPVSSPRVGDLVFFRHGKRVDHVGLYLGNQNMLHAPRRGRTVSIERIDKPYWQKRYAGARRVRH